MQGEAQFVHISRTKTWHKQNSLSWPESAPQPCLISCLGWFRQNLRRIT